MPLSPPPRRLRALQPAADDHEAPRHPSGAAGPRRRVAVLTTYADRWYFGTMLAGIERIVHQAGHEVVVHQVGQERVELELARESPARLGFDAVVTVALPLPPDLVRAWEDQGVPVVVAGARVPGAECVYVDDVRVGRLATEHLVRLGHRRVAMVRTCDEQGRVWPADLERTEGYLEALSAASVPYDAGLVVTVPFGPRGGASAVSRLMSLPEPPTAIFAACDEVAFGCLPALGSLGLRVPGRVSVVGVDDHPLSEVLGLTTVDQGVGLQGELAGRLALDALVGLREQAPQEWHEVPVEVLSRDTSAPRRTLAVH